MTVPILSAYGLHPRSIHYDLPTPLLNTHAIRRVEGELTHLGSLSMTTGHVGRSPDDTYIVQDDSTRDSVFWAPQGHNNPITPENVDGIYEHMQKYLEGYEVFIQDLFAVRYGAMRVPVRFIGTKAWQALFARNMLVIPETAELENFEPELTVIGAPDFVMHPVPGEYGLRSKDFIIRDLTRRRVLIGGSGYGGEIKKSIFTYLNYVMLERGVLPMHASVVVDARGRTTIMWGLSGTGKTTHSMNPKFRLVGDDEHGWGPDGVFNFEGGVYAKTQDLDPNKERYIHAATQRFGTTLENVHIDPVSLRPDFYNTSYTPNGRASFSLDAIPGCVTDEIVSHPENGIFLTADAYGVLPPIARLDRGQDLYWFYLGYTSKLAGTERGLSKNPEPVFSALFGQPFFPRHFEEYVRMFERLVKEHNTRVWLVNTGWTGGPYGTGHRIDIADSMAMIDAVTNGSLDEVPFTRDPVFGFDIPESCPNVASSILSPRSTWHSSEAYDRARAQLAKRFIEKAKQLDMPRDILKGGPQTS